MRTLFSLLLFVFTVALSAQEKNFLDRPFLETSATVDTLITPDRIYMNIILQESDSRGKKTTEELEKAMEQELRKLGIDISKDLTLLDAGSNFKRYFLKSQDILKSKAYSLLVRDAVTAAKVLQSLEAAEISNVSIARTEYSKHENLKLVLKSKAITKAKEHAEYLATPLNQKIGKALHILDNGNNLGYLQGQVAGLNIAYGSGAPGASSRIEVLQVEFEKIKYEMRVDVKFALE